MIVLRNKTYIYALVLLMSSTILLLPSCKKDDKDDPILYNTYVSHEFLTSYSSNGIKSLFQTVQVLYPEVAPLIQHIQYDVDVYKVVYRTPYQGEIIEASGLVCVPVSTDGIFPIVSFQNGTNTAHNEAPSVDYSSTLHRYLESSSSMGYIMLMPDYIGFGSSEQIIHPYMDKESTVTSVENIIIATGEMIDNGLLDTQWNNDAFLMGYSQGGWATLSTHKYLAEKSGLSFDLVASSCGAGPFSLSVVQNYMFEGVVYPQPVYMAYTAVSYHSLGLITNPLTDYFNEPYATSLPTYFDGSMSNGQVNEQLNDTVAVLVNSSFLAGVNSDPLYEEFRNAMTSNSVIGWNTLQPIHFYHGTADNYVPPATTELVYQQFIDAGASDMVTYYPLEGKDHGTGAIPMVVGSLIWFNEIK